MVETLAPIDLSGDFSAQNLLVEDETIIIAGDFSSTLQTNLKKNLDLPSISAGSITELMSLIDSSRAALVILDLELIEQGGMVLQELTGHYPYLSIIIVCLQAKLATVLHYLRSGADDCLTRPINDEQMRYVVGQVLKERRQAIDNRVNRRELQITNLRTQFLHHLISTMNSGYLSDVELEVVLQTILIGITSEEGLAFNRAFLALFNDDGSVLKGQLAIGPDNQADALAIWEEIKNEKLDLQALFQRSSLDLHRTNGVVNNIVKSLVISIDDTDHPLIQACRSRRSVLVNGGRADIAIPKELIATLNQDSFVIVPLYSPDRSLGVIIADNFITGKPIESGDVKALEIFAGQASLAIEHSRLHRRMQKQIRELELITEELDRNRDMLVESERFTALGQMSAQLVHALRNPITSIGGTARLLDKRISEQQNRKFLKVLAKESAKVESTLNDLFNFVSDTTLNKTEQYLFDIVRRAGMVFYGTMKKQGISYQIELPDQDPLLDIDGEKIHQAFLHLLRNGIESMDSGGTLSIGAEISNTHIAVSISDTGTGMDNGDLSRVTDPFYTTKTYGTGMGLTLVKQILKQHNAQFSLIANDDQGMTATVTFPRP